MDVEAQLNALENSLTAAEARVGRLPGGGGDKAQNTLSMDDLESEDSDAPASDDSSSEEDDLTQGVTLAVGYVEKIQTGVLEGDAAFAAINESHAIAEMLRAADRVCTSPFEALPQTHCLPTHRCLVQESDAAELEAIIFEVEDALEVGRATQLLEAASNPSMSVAEILTSVDEFNAKLQDFIDRGASTETVSTLQDVLSNLQGIADARVAAIVSLGVGGWASGSWEELSPMVAYTPPLL